MDLLFCFRKMQYLILAYTLSICYQLYETCLFYKCFNVVNFHMPGQITKSLVVILQRLDRYRLIGRFRMSQQWAVSRSLTFVSEELKVKISLSYNTCFYFSLCVRQNMSLSVFSVFFHRVFVLHYFCYIYNICILQKLLIYSYIPKYFRLLISTQNIGFILSPWSLFRSNMTPHHVVNIIHQAEPISACCYSLPLSYSWCITFLFHMLQDYYWEILWIWLDYYWWYSNGACEECSYFELNFTDLIL